MTVTVRRANLTDLTYVAANAREIDRREILASGPASMRDAAFITFHVHETCGGVMYAADLNDNPEVVFGMSPQSALTPWLYSAWMWGTERTPILMPDIMRWTHEFWVGLVRDLGITRIEVRSLIDHHEAHRWLEWLGMARQLELVDWGRDRTRFVLYTWTVTDLERGAYDHVLARSRRASRKDRQTAPR